jgi:phosphopantothenoylcysteine decarboxylase/phosphopantothenate--cysteine ligase
MAKTVVLGVTGSIAAYKAADIVSKLKKRGVAVRVILTESGAEFITPLTLETLSAAPVVCDMFNRETPWEVEHIALAKLADVFVIAPASADFISKAASGIADDMLTTTLLATRAPIIIAPAMNCNMYSNDVIQQNMETLKRRGATFVDPSSGLLACGDTGIGRLADTDEIVEAIMATLYKKRDLEGKKLIVTAGPTREKIDPVRHISNRSSGKMGYAIAEAAIERGARVTLITGPVALKPPEGAEVIRVESTEDMLEAVLSVYDSCDAVIKAAAPADFTIAPAKDKIKKDGGALTLTLVPTPDILASLGEHKGKRVLIGFAAESRELEKYAKDKLERKNLDMIVANDITRRNAGFDVDTNAVTFYHRTGEKEELPLMRKREVAEELLDRLVKLL